MDIYERAYFDRWRNMIGDKNLGSAIIMSSDYAFLFHFGKKRHHGQLVVDFGGNIGANSRQIENTVVVEISDAAREWMNANGVKCEKSIDSFADGSIDTIYCSHVLEHLEEPVRYLRLFRKKLKKGGKLLLVLPSENQMFEPQAPLFDENGHLQTWNFVHIATSLRLAGFSITHQRLIPRPHLLFFLPERVLRTSRLRPAFLNAVHSLYNFKPVRYFFYQAALFELFIKSLRLFAYSLFGKMPGSGKYGYVFGENLIEAAKTD
ncbi:Methyltransferase domain protein [Candidatus Anstonella stagnisolia]|nr:Methyltransferase domain protein [Candidatus Anstonella stagnisolia]